MKPDHRKYVIFAVIGALALVLDQWTKSLARQFLLPFPHRRRTIVEGFWDLRYSANSGVAFGMFQSSTLLGRVVLSGVAIVAFFIVLHYLRRTEARHTRLHAALALVGGGAIGNLIDRIVFGRVTDFIVWHVKEHEWPAFNVADAALVVGVALMALDMIPRRSAPPPAGGDQRGSQ